MDLTETRGHSSRFGRTGYGDGGSTQGPSVQSQVVANAVPEVRAPMQGFSALSNSLNTFFGQANNALDMIGNAVQARQRFEHEKDMQLAKLDNEKEARKAQTDALAGRAMDPSLSNDRDYTEVYIGLKGQRGGLDLYEAWKANVLQKTAIDSPDNILTSTEAWLKSEVGPGTGDDVFDNAMLSSFWKAAEGDISQFNSNREKAFRVKQVDDVLASVTDRIGAGQFQVTDVRDAIEAVRGLSPELYQEAPQLVLNRVFAVTSNNPEQSQAMINYLNDPASGVNGRSAAQTWPEAAAAMEDKYVSNFQNGVTWESNKLYNELDDRLLKVGQAEDPMAELQDIMASAEDYRIRFGGGNRRDAIVSKVMTAVDKLADDTANLNYFSLYVDDAIGNEPDAVPDTTALEKGQLQYINKVGGLAANPVQLGVVVDKSGVIHKDLKTSASNGLRNLTDPTAFANSFNFYRAIAQGRRGIDGAMEFMDQDARSTFLRASAMFDQGNQDLAVIAQQIALTKDDYDAISKMSWKEITGLDKDADKKVDSVIQSAFIDTQTSLLSNDPDMVFTPANMQKLRDLAKNEIANSGKAGVTDWETATKRALITAKDQISLTPAEDGKVILQVGVVPPQKRFGREHLYPGYKEAQDDISVFHEDVDSFLTQLPDLESQGFDASDPDEFSANYDARVGAYQVANAGRPLFLSQFQVDSLDKAGLEGIDKDRLQFLKRDVYSNGEQQTMYLVYYLPGPTGAKLATAADKAPGYTQPKPKPAPRFTRAPYTQ